MCVCVCVCVCMCMCSVPPVNSEGRGGDVHQVQGAYELSPVLLL